MHKAIVPLLKLWYSTVVLKSSDSRCLQECILYHIGYGKGIDRILFYQWTEGRASTTKGKRTASRKVGEAETHSCQVKTHTLAAVIPNQEESQRHESVLWRARDSSSTWDTETPRFYMGQIPKTPGFEIQ